MNNLLHYYHFCNILWTFLANTISLVYCNSRRYRDNSNHNTVFRLIDFDHFDSLFVN